MALNGDIKTSEVGSGIQVAVRVRPLNNRERDEGFRSCVTFDEPSRQVVLQAVDKETLMQLRGCTAKGFAFDRRFGADQSSDDIYDACVAGLVENLFKGYNATVLAYGQTGSGKTHTMTGGVGIHGVEEQGITRRAARHIFQIVDRVKQRLKPGEAIGVSAYALELYNEDLRDLSIKGANGQESARDRAERRAAAIVSGSAPRDIAAAAAGGSGGGGVGSGASTPRERAGTPEPGEVRIAERPVGRDGRVVPEVLGVQQVQVEDAQSLTEFFQECCENRSVASTRMNDRSSRSHAIYTVVLHRIMVDVSEDGGKVRTTSFESKFHLVDLAGSERVKRSGVTGQAFKEATHINSGLLALGNVIVALSGDGPAGGGGETPTAAGSGAAGAAFSAAAAAAVGGGGRRTHIPYRDSKLTRLLQDSLGGNSLTVLISCISSCEADFEETANTLKYANRACRIKNTPLPAKYSTLEEDLLPMLPEGSGGVHGMVQIQSLLEDHARLKELREKREAEKRDKGEKRLTELRAMREAESKKPGYQRLRIMQYDELRRKLTSSQGLTVSREAVIADDTLAGFRKREEDDSDGSSVGSSGPSFSRPTTASRAAGGAGSGRASPSPRDGQRPSRPMTAAARLGGGSSSDGAISPRGAPRAPRGSPAPAAAAAAAAPAVGPATVDEGVESMEPRAAVGERQPSVIGVAVDALGAKLEGAKLSCIDEGMQTSPASGAAGDLIRAWRASDGEQPDAVGREVAGEAEAAEAAVAAAPSAAAMVDEAVGVMEDAASEAAAAAEAADAADAAALAEAEAVAAGKGVFSPFVQLEFKPRPEGDAPAVDTAATAAVETVRAPAIPAVAPPKLLARFRVNKVDSMAVFMATTAEDFRDVVGLLPANSALPASDKMSYLLGRLEVNCAGPGGLMRALQRVAAGEATMGEAVGPAVGCLMATMGTSLITDCIFDFEDPEELEGAGQEQRLELWGLQIPHSLSVRPPLTPLADASEASALKTSDSTWSTASAWTPGQLQTQSALQTGGHDLRWGSADRLNVSVGLLYALCAAAQDAGAIAGFCVPRPQLLKRWLQAGVKMRQVQGPARLIYPPTAHDYAYYKGSTVAYFLVPEVKASLEQVLSVVHEAA